MSFKEKANVANAISSNQFPEIEWIPCENFKKIISTKRIEPFITQSNGKLMFIGKNTPNFNSDLVVDRIELIGPVIENDTGEWQILLSYASEIIRRSYGFKVLNVPLRNSYEWLSSSNGEVPVYALRGAMDNDSEEYLYIGKTILCSQPNVRYFENSILYNYNDKVEDTFGKVHCSHGNLYIPYRSKELSISQYQVLCLRPLVTDNVQSLKKLYQIFLRKVLNNDNRKINKLSDHLPKSIVEYIKHQTYLKQGDYLFKGDILASEDSRYLLFINKNDTITCRDIDEDKEIYFQFNMESISVINNGIYLNYTDSIRYLKLVTLNKDFNYCNVKLIISKYGFKSKEPVRFTIKYEPDNGMDNIIHEISFGYFSCHDNS